MPGPGEVVPTPPLKAKKGGLHLTEKRGGSPNQGQGSIRPELPNVWQAIEGSYSQDKRTISRAVMMRIWTAEGMIDIEAAPGRMENL